MDVEGQAVIVTGGSSGIGKAIAERFVDEGANVVIGDVDDETGEDVADSIGADYQHCDVSDYDDVADLVSYTVDQHGKLDCIVNNAGIGSIDTIEEMDIDDYHDIIAVDLHGVMYGCKAATPHLKETEGCIINIASIYGLVGDMGATAYNTAKGGVVNLTRSVADDLAQHNVRVNSICPGFVKTRMTRDVQEDDAFHQHIIRQTPLGRMAEPEEIAGLAIFLASEEASYITGANIPVDGGWTSH